MVVWSEWLELVAQPLEEIVDLVAQRQHGAHELLHRVVEATLDALPGHYGEVLEWKYLDGHSVQEIASRLELGPKAAESLLTRAREAFRDAIEDLAGASDELTGPLGRSPG